MLDETLDCEEKRELDIATPGGDAVRPDGAYLSTLEDTLRERILALPKIRLLDSKTRNSEMTAHGFIKLKWHPLSPDPSEMDSDPGMHSDSDAKSDSAEDSEEDGNIYYPEQSGHMSEFPVQKCS